MGKRVIRVATRGSKLALIQADMTIEALKREIDADFEVVQIKTSGDKYLDWSLKEHGGTGLFTKEIEEALLNKEVDIAVHSAKDLPSNMPSDLDIVACLKRDSCADVVAVDESVLTPNLIASGSPRRRWQLKKLFPQAVWTDIRGNVETRLKKVLSSQIEATVLSEAGLSRLGISKYEGIKFNPIKLDLCVPAVGQGIIAIQSRKEDTLMYNCINDEATMQAWILEREFLLNLGGGCQVAYAANYDGELFRFYHESCGIQKIRFADGASLEAKLDIVREITSGIITDE